MIGWDGGLLPSPYRVDTLLIAPGALIGLPGLPSSLENIPLEYFERALRWLAKQPAVDPHRIVTFGSSRGGEASLLIASTFPRLVHGAVGYVPSAAVRVDTRAANSG